MHCESTTETNFPSKISWDVEGVRSAGYFTWFKEISEELPKGRVISDGKNMLMLGGYSYLGLNKNPLINQAATEAISKYGTGMSGSRFLSGTTEIHRQLEELIASLHSKEMAICYSSGYLANVSTIISLVKSNDFVIADRLNHASIIDGCRYSRASFLRYRHNDMSHLEQLLKTCPKSSRKLVIVDAVFSMTGEPANLPDIVSVCRKYNAILMVDECHSFYVMGESGRGITEYFNMDPEDIDISMATLSKAIPGGGGYITSSKEIIDYIRYESRGFIYSIALSVVLASAALKGLEIFMKEGKCLVSKLNKNTQAFKNVLKSQNIPIGNSVTSIIPILVGDSYKAAEAAKLCQDNGLFIHAVFPPVVPKGKAILRASITSAHSESDLVDAANSIAGILKNL